MKPPRDYQSRTISRVFESWQSGHRAPLVVAPTGAGKTCMAEHVIDGCLRERHRVGFLVHTRELLNQTAETLRSSFGHLNVGVIGPGHQFTPHAKVQVATVQTLVAREALPDLSTVIYDEAHHYPASSWGAIAEHYSNVRAVGFTATPKRADGRPLGDIFDDLIVSISYSELITRGVLVPVRAFRPPTRVTDGLANDPLVSWQRYGEGRPTFAFAPSVKMAEEQTRRFADAGITTALIHGKLSRRSRDEAIDSFRAGETTVLWNCNVLTEGVDVPAASCLLSLRAFNDLQAYLQASGRVLRSHPGKADAIIIDLTGASIKHGLPTQDRDYSLDGDGIRLSAETLIRQCLKCGAVVEAHYMICPECGHKFARRDPRIPVIYDLELQEVFDGRNTPPEAKLREYQRLREEGKRRGWSLYFIRKSYRDLFKETTVIHDATDEEMFTEYSRLRKIQSERGYKHGWVGVNFKQVFGVWPPPRIARSSQDSLHGTKTQTRNH